MSEGIKGLQEVQRANLKLIAAVKPNGGLGRAVLYAATDIHRYAVSITHVDTGALKASHRIEKIGAASYRIFIDPAAKNPRSGARTSVYGPAEHNRGGEHAFYERTMNERGKTIAVKAHQMMRSELP
jgi:hypothetical protein